jgi:hypothetical protein
MHSSVFYVFPYTGFIMRLISSVNTVTSLGPGRPGNWVWIPDNGQIFFHHRGLGHIETNVQSLSNALAPR